MSLDRLPAVPVRLLGGPLDGDEHSIDPRWLPHVTFPLPPRPFWEREAYLDRFDHPIALGIQSAVYSFEDFRLPPIGWLTHFGYVPLRSR